MLEVRSLGATEPDIDLRIRAGENLLASLIAWLSYIGSPLFLRTEWRGVGVSFGQI
jgi:hypothetical protein